MLRLRNRLVRSFLLGLFPVSFVCSAGGSSFELEELAPGVYLHQGHHVSLESSRRGDSANIGFIVGEQCVAVVDSGGSVQTGKWLAYEIKERIDKPVCYLINTHVHFDHVLGNAAFSDPKLKLVAHPNFAGALIDSSEFFSDKFASEVDGGVLPHEIDGSRVPVDRKIAIDLGNRKLTVEAHRAAHSRTDVTIFDEATNTLWAGDLLFRERMPVLDGSLAGWIDWMETVIDKTYSLVIPGHGKPDRNWPEGALAQFRYLKTLLDETREAIAAGIFIEDAKNIIGVDEKLRWELSERAHARNVSQAFRELEWE